MTINDKVIIRRQLDRKIIAIKEVEGSLTAPKTGWLKTIREAIDITAQQAVKKIGKKQIKSQQSWAKIEASEAKGTISINSLRQYAAAINCKVVYALVPNTTSLEDLLMERARMVAKKIIVKTHHTMQLEGQGISNEEMQKQIEDMARDLVINLRSDIWED